jgi:hypothetical protein
MQPIDSLRAQLQGGDEEELFDALTDIGKKRIRALEADVVPFLQHRSGELRGAAARTLGFHLRAQAHRDAIRHMAGQDPDPEARAGAIVAWTTLLAGTRDPDAMRTLEAWLRDRAAPYLVRSASFWGLLDVGGLPRDRWPAPRAYANIDADVPWELVDEVLAPSFGRTA